MTKPGAGKSPNDRVLHVRVPAQPRKRPRQSRSIVLVNALKETGRDILENEGGAALTASRLSERSGVAVSSIYEYFPTMESLVAAIFQDDRIAMRREAVARIEALPPSATLFDGIELMLRLGLAGLHKWSLLDPQCNVNSAHYDELIRLDLIKAEPLWSVVVAPVLLERFSDEVRVRDRDKALFLFDQTLQALSHAIRIEKPAYLGEPDTVLLLTRMLHALLTTRDENCSGR
jgi:AcrR family transcriptional regulator